MNAETQKLAEMVDVPIRKEASSANVPKASFYRPWGITARISDWEFASGKYERYSLQQNTGSRASMSH